MRRQAVGRRSGARGRSLGHPLAPHLSGSRSAGAGITCRRGKEAATCDPSITASRVTPPKSQPANPPTSALRTLHSPPPKWSSPSLEYAEAPFPPIAPAIADPRRNTDAPQRPRPRPLRRSRCVEPRSEFRPCVLQPLPRGLHARSVPRKPADCLPRQPPAPIGENAHSSA